jgi:hypothetical protein
MNIEAFTGKLAASGLILLDGEPVLTSCPPEAASQASACGPEHGRVDEVIDLKRPDALRDVNAAWYRLATRFGLFGERGEFLLFVNLSDDDVRLAPGEASRELEHGRIHRGHHKRSFTRRATDHVAAR